MCSVQVQCTVCVSHAECACCLSRLRSASGPCSGGCERDMIIADRCDRCLVTAMVFDTRRVVRCKNEKAFCHSERTHGSKSMCTDRNIRRRIRCGLRSSLPPASRACSCSRLNLTSYNQGPHTPHRRGRSSWLCARAGGRLGLTPPLVHDPASAPRTPRGSLRVTPLVYSTQTTLLLHVPFAICCGREPRANSIVEERPVKRKVLLVGEAFTRVHNVQHRP